MRNALCGMSQPHTWLMLGLSLGITALLEAVTGSLLGLMPADPKAPWPRKLLILLYVKDPRGNFTTDRESPLHYTSCKH
jgi:hypothetical protein